MPSRVIRSFAYDAPSRSLNVVFVSGRRFRYDGVPADVADAMRLSFAKGAFFNRHIRGYYPAVAMAEPANQSRPISEA